MYLVLVDAFSKWPEVYRMTRTTTDATTTALQDVCARLGTMDTLVTDNGPQFTSAAFNTFTRKNAIEHIRTAPYHPQSNGLAERFVDSLKRALARSLNDSRTGLREFLMSYRTTPNESAPERKSPAELMMGRRLRTPLSTVHPPAPRSTTKNEAMEQQFNQHHGAKQRQFNKGDPVYVQTGPQASWTEGRIAATHGRVMFEVVTTDGQRRRTHTNQLRPRQALPLDILLNYRAPQDAAAHQASQPAARRAPYHRTSPPILRPRPTARVAR